MANEILTNSDDAKALKQNPLWGKIWSDLESILEERLLTCNTTKDKELIADIARCKQLTKTLRSRLEKYIETGDAEMLRLKELAEKSAMQNLVRVFKR